MTYVPTPPATRSAHVRGALAHAVDPWTWWSAFELRAADATIAPAIRVGLATGIVFGAAGLLGYRDLAGFAALGALASAFGRYEPYPRLAGKVLLVGVALVVFVGVGGALGAAELPVWGVIGVLSLAAGAASFYMNAFQLVGPGPVILVFAATGAAGFSASPGDVVAATSAAAIGVLVGWFAAMLPAPVLPLGPARLAAARALGRVGSLEREGETAVPGARESLHRAREVLAASGCRSRRHRHGQDLAHLLDAADEAIDIWIATGDVSGLRAIAAHEPELRKIKRCSVVGGAGDRTVPRTELPAPIPLLQTARQNFTSAPLRHAAARTVFAAAAAGWIAAACGVAHPLWASMGAVAALQGVSYTHTVQRGIQRLLGNIGGALVAVGLVALSLGYWQAVIVVVLLQTAAELLVLVNYALTSLAITPMALVLTGFTAPLSASDGVSRIVDTLIGVVIGVVVAAVSVSRTDHSHLS